MLCDLFCQADSLSVLGLSSYEDCRALLVEAGFVVLPKKVHFFAFPVEAR